MSDPGPRRGPSTPTEWVIAGIFLAAILVAFAAEILDDYTPFKLSAVLFVAFWMPLIAVHEAGHAVVAFVFGWRVKQIVIGMGNPIGRFRIGSADVEIRLFAIEGVVRCVPTKLRLPHFESALIFFGGPGIELLLAAGIVLIGGADVMLEPSDEYGVIVWQSLALAAAAQAVFNLIPFVVRGADGDLVSDGFGIILSLFRPWSYYEAMIVRWLSLFFGGPFMRGISFGMVAVGLLAITGLSSGGDDKKAAADLKKLQGTWQFLSQSVGGKDRPKEDVARLTITFAGDKWTVRDGDKLVQAGTHKLDPSKKPNQVDAIVTDGEGKGGTT